MNRLNNFLKEVPIFRICSDLYIPTFEDINLTCIFPCSHHRNNISPNQHWRINDLPGFEFQRVASLYRLRLAASASGRRRRLSKASRQGFSDGFCKGLIIGSLRQYVKESYTIWIILKPQSFSNLSFLIVIF